MVSINLGPVRGKAFCLECDVAEFHQYRKLGDET